MSDTFFLILPTQLFEKKYLPKYVVESKIQVILWECPWYFNNPKYTFNKKKIILHKASIEYYYTYLKASNININKVSYDQNINDVITSSYSMFDPIDDIKLLSLPAQKISHIEESPNFLMAKVDYENYRNKTDKFFFNPFYMYGKKIVDIIPEIKSTDAYNRKTPAKTELSNLKIPKIPTLSVIDKKFIGSGITYASKYFHGNYGNVDNFIFPVTHATAKKWLTFFIKYKFANFGNYQDVINKDNDYMFHSLLSTSINIGLLNPRDIIDAIKKIKNITINNYEGYIRQLFWREYQRYTYIYYFSDIKNQKLNYFNNTNKLTANWYNGTTGILPVDDAIIKGFDSGYLHHIIRLMVVGNYMNLSGISPLEGFKWFMEFSCDSYEWVMYQNVLGMAFFADGGKTMRRPYVSSSNYVIKMSNYGKGDWCVKWDLLYKNFIKNKSDKLQKYRYFYRNT
jgi:deoxyribodipyrimidine photolyase-related protein